MSLHNQQQRISNDVAQLKLSLEGWKFLLVPINNLLEWERSIDPVIIFILNTFIFGLMAYYNPSILTTISIIGLTCLLLESIVPLVVNYFFKSTEWDIVSESKYTRICERISNLNRHIENFKLKLHTIRKERQSLYFLIVFFFLIFCAYVGQSVDNFLLTYLATLIATLTPGIRRHNLVPKVILNIKKTIGIGGSSAQSKSSITTSSSNEDDEHFRASTFTSSINNNNNNNNNLKQRYNK
jgi:ADP-ribosylation factor-like protein 6-interacting protein 1